jgi:hypothetical protein
VDIDEWESLAVKMDDPTGNYCGVCGAFVRAHAAGCGICGEPQSATHKARLEAEEEEREAKELKWKKYENPFNNKGCGFAVVVILAIIVVAFAIGLTAGDEDTSTTSGADAGSRATATPSISESVGSVDATRYFATAMPLVERSAALTNTMVALSSDPLIFDPEWQRQVREVSSQARQLGREVDALVAPKGWEDVHAALSSGIDHFVNAGNLFESGATLMFQGDLDAGSDKIIDATNEMSSMTVDIQRATALLAAKAP